HLRWLERSIVDARTRLTVHGLAWRILGADAHLKSGTAAARAAFSICVFWFVALCHCEMSDKLQFVVEPGNRQTKVCRTSNMNRLVVHAFGGFHDGFGNCRVRVHRVAQLFRS